MYMQKDIETHSQDLYVFLYKTRPRFPTLGFLHPVRPVLWDRDSSLLNSATILHIPQRMARKKNQKINIFFMLDMIGFFMV